MQKEHEIANNKKTIYLYNVLVRDQKSIFYASDRITNDLIRKANNSLYLKDKVFVRLLKDIDRKKVFINKKTPLNTLFVEKKQDVDSSTLYSFKGPFEAFQVDIVDIQFLGKSAVDPKYCLLFVDLFTSMIYTHPMKNRKILAKKIAQFYQDIAKKRSGQMRLQTDQEFQQNNIKKLNKEYDVDMYSTKLRGGKAFVAEPKIRELKKVLLRSKRIQKLDGKRVKPNELIKKSTFNLNNSISPKYGYAPQKIETKSLDKDTGKNFQEIYDFHRLRKVKENRLRNEKYAERLDSIKKRKLRVLNVGEKVLVLAEHLKKKDAPGKLYKSTTENRPFFDRNRIFTISKPVKVNNGPYHYWLEENGQKINGRFLREELLALNEPFV